MRRYSGSTAAAFLTLLSLCSAFHSPLEAQAAPPVFVPEDRTEAAPARPGGLGRLAAGAALGGIVGAAGVAALTMPFSDDGDFGPPPWAIAGAVAYPLGASLGAHWLGRTPSVAAPMGASLIGTAAGAGVWAGIGNAFDPEGRGDPGGDSDYTAWIVGAALGFATHVAVTALLTDRWQPAR